MDTFEDLGTALGTVEVDREALIWRAVLAGRRRQRRRRLAAGAGVVAAGALVVGQGAHVAGSSVAVDSGVTTQPTSDPTSQPTGPTAPDEDGSGVPSPSLTDGRLVARLPVPGDLVSTQDLHGTVVVRRTLDPDGSGTGTVSLSLLAEKPLAERQIADETDKCRLVSNLDGPEQCRPVLGGWLFTFAGHPDVEGAPPKALDWSATVNFKDGTSVQLHATNYVDHANPERAAPVLDPHQIEQLVLDPVWFQPTR